MAIHTDSHVIENNKQKMMVRPIGNTSDVDKAVGEIFAWMRYAELGACVCNFAGLSVKVFCGYNIC